jgi:hypothetical protein
VDVRRVYDTIAEWLLYSAGVGAVMLGFFMLTNRPLN